MNAKEWFTFRSVVPRSCSGGRTAKTYMFWVHGNGRASNSDNAIENFQSELAGNDVSQLELCVCLSAIVCFFGFMKTYKMDDSCVRAKPMRVVGTLSTIYALAKYILMEPNADHVWDHQIRPRNLTVCPDTRMRLVETRGCAFTWVHERTILRKLS
jgi:hypothetical protein